MTKQVGSSLKDLAGNPLIGVGIEVQLVLGQAWGTTTKIGYSETYKTLTDNNGLWTAILPENDLLNPIGTLYRIVERLPSQYGGTRTYVIQVLSSLGGGLNQVVDLIVPEMSPVGSINTFLTKAYADATYSPVGTSVGPAGPTGPPGASALANVYSLEATLLADSPSNGTYGYATDTGRTWARLASGWKYISGGTHFEIQSSTLVGGPTVGAAALSVGTLLVATLPYARTAVVCAEINKTQTIATDTFELSISDGTNTRAQQHSPNSLLVNPMQTPPLLVAIAALATPTFTVTLARVAGTGTATIVNGANYNRMDALYKPQE